MQVGSVTVLPPSICMQGIVSVQRYWNAAAFSQTGFMSLTECRYALTRYFPVLVGKHVSATYLVLLSGSVAIGSFTSALTQGTLVGCRDDLFLRGPGRAL